MQFWVDNLPNTRTEETTNESYVNNFENHIKPFFSKLNLGVSEVRQQHIESFITQQHQSGRVDGKGGVKSRSIKKYVANISKTFDLAIKKGLISHNPTLRVEYPRDDEPYEADFYTAEEIEKLLKLCKGKPLEVPIILATHFALRRAEIKGLRWQDIDFKQNTMTIRNTRVRITTETEKKPKNKSSHRTFPLIPTVKPFLERLYAEQQQQAEQFGSDYIFNDYVCKWPNGKKYDVGYANRALGKLLQKNGMRHICLHGLRHSAASYLQKLGVSDKLIQIWMGHSDIRTTMNIYTHVDTSMKEDTANQIGKLFGNL